MGKSYRGRPIKRGDILFVRKGKDLEVGSEQQADRPAVVISNNSNNSFSSNIEVAYLTAQVKKLLPTHLETNNAKKKSTVLCEGITTVSKSRIDYYHGKLDEQELELLNKAIAISVGLEKYIYELEKLRKICQKYKQDFSDYRKNFDKLIKEKGQIAKENKLLYEKIRILEQVKKLDAINSDNTLYEDLKNAYFKITKENRVLQNKVVKAQQENRKLKSTITTKLASSY